MFKLKEDGMVRFVNFLAIFSLVLTGLLISPAVGADKGDLTGDSFVDIDDVVVIADNWLEDYPRADLAPINDPNVSISDGDGIVDFQDFGLLAQNWKDESLTVSSNALDFCLSQILATDASEWGTDRYPSRTAVTTTGGGDGYTAWYRTYHKSDPSGDEPWTVGFFPGCMWYMYELTGDSSIKSQAMLWTERLQENVFKTQYRDHGFVILCSYGHGYRLGGAECSDYKTMVLMAAVVLDSAGYNADGANVDCL
jgi:hypothetical protein